MSLEDTAIKLRELVEEGVLVETDPEEVVMSEEFMGYMEKALDFINRLEREGVELPEDRTRGAVLYAYIGFMGTADETELPIKVSLISTFLELIRDNRLEEWP